MGGKFHLKLNIDERPIANKYREGKMKRTLKRELKVLEIVEREAMKTSRGRVSFSGRSGRLVLVRSYRRTCVSGPLWPCPAHLVGSASIRRAGESWREGDQLWLAAV